MVSGNFLTYQGVLSAPLSDVLLVVALGPLVINMGLVAEAGAIAAVIAALRAHASVEGIVKEGMWALGVFCGNNGSLLLYRASSLCVHNLWLLSVLFCLFLDLNISVAKELLARDIVECAIENYSGVAEILSKGIFLRALFA